MVAVHKSRKSRDEQAANFFLNVKTLSSNKAQAIEVIRLGFKNTVVLSDS